MSTNKDYVVMLNDADSYNTFTAEMAANTGSGNIPNRSVTKIGGIPDRFRVKYLMTDAEALALKDDSRVSSIFIYGERNNPI